MPSNSSSGSGKSEGGNDTMDVGEGIVGAALFGSPSDLSRQTVAFSLSLYFVYDIIQGSVGDSVDDCRLFFYGIGKTVTICMTSHLLRR